jgi:hypothetical protein
MMGREVEYIANRVGMAEGWVQAQIDSPEGQELAKELSSKTKLPGIKKDEKKVEKWTEAQWEEELDSLSQECLVAARNLLNDPNTSPTVIMKIAEAVWSRAKTVPKPAATTAQDNRKIIAIGDNYMEAAFQALGMRESEQSTLIDVMGY